MNKNLEKEYRELMTENAPDLWERIEAGLESKQPTAKKDNLWRRYRTWGWAAAACLCMLVAVPVILRKNAEGSMRSESVPSYDNGTADGNLSAAENASGLLGVSSAEAAAATYIIMGTVTDVLEEDGRVMYIVDIFRTDLTELSKGDSIRLYSDWDFSEDVLEGEEYLFDIVVSTANNGTREYLIGDIW